VSANLLGTILFFFIITISSHATGLCVVFMMHTDDQGIETLLHNFMFC
jgi:hypothetical protein